MVEKAILDLNKRNEAPIIYIKYYDHITQGHYDKHTLYSHNLYQIFTYVKNCHYVSDKNVSGLLLYAKTDEEIQPDSVFQIHGNRFSVKTLDLTLPFSQIAGQLDKIAEAYFGEQSIHRLWKSSGS
ncbi:MAG: hypothetical protein LKE40_07890 [Spirochaetia bacterium]|jgi:5-methylcytosine-specific restriction enzyme subunit McrC|nr:hypothetical protein [Spirochaetia bacterium]